MELAVAPRPLTPIGRFRRLKLLGEGGFGCVYLARADDDGPLVALKLVRNSHFANESTIRRFRSEIRILSDLRHDRIVRMYEAGEHEGLPFFTMESMEGGTLRQRMAEFHASPRKAAKLLIKIAEAVEFLHGDPERPERPTILHRDLKPENILFDAAGEPRISDFGIAKFLTGENVTKGSQRFGSAPYMAPEQVYRAENTVFTPATDVYSLGALLYELFTGRPPFGDNEIEVFRRLDREEPRPPRQLAPSLDRYLETVVLNALEKKPERRYASARAFARDLHRALEGKPPEDV